MATLVGTCTVSKRCISSQDVGLQVIERYREVYILPGRQSTFSQDVGLPLTEMSTELNRFTRLRKTRHREVYISTSHRDVYISTGRRSGTARLRIGLEWFSVFLGTMEISVLKSKRLSKTLPHDFNS